MNSNINNKNKIQKNSKINHTSSKPVKKMILWTRVKNSKSTSPHIKQDTNPNLGGKKIIKQNHSGQRVKNNSKEKSTLSPLLKPKEVTNYIKNRNYLNNSKISTSKILTSQVTSFQSNSNEENKSSSKFGDSNSKKSDKKPRFFNNIKFRKYINMNYSLNNNNSNNNNSNNNVNINSSEYHINNTYKYFQASNGINLRKKNKNKINCVTDNTHIFLNPSKKSVNKKKSSKEKEQKKTTISKKSLYIFPSQMTNPQSQRSKKLLSSSLHQLTSDNLNEKNNIWNKIQKNSFSDRFNENDFEKMKILEKENSKLKNENNELIKINKDLKILVNKLENEILEIKSVIKDNLNLFLQPEKDMIKKSYNDFIEQIEKEKINISKILNYQQKQNINREKASKTKEDNFNYKNTNIDENNLIKDRRNDFRNFKKNFLELFNQVNTSNIILNGNPTGNDPLKNILNSFCCYMDNIMNKLEDNYIKLNKKEKNLEKNETRFDKYINNFSEVCIINLYYQFVIMQLFNVSFFERQHCYYCFSILDYILSSPFMIIKNNDYIKENIEKINNLIEVYKKVNEEYVNKFTEQTFFYLNNYIKLFNIIINNKIYINNNIKIDLDTFNKNTEILFDKDDKKQKVYFDMINNLLETIQKCKIECDKEKLFEKKIKAKNKINLIKLSGDNYDKISNVSNASSKIIDNYSEKPSFYGFLKSEECPPDMSFDDEEL
mgnify:CR=1 FL=1